MAAKVKPGKMLESYKTRSTGESAIRFGWLVKLALAAVAVALILR
jgi:hypothetical protein